MQLLKITFGEFLEDISNDEQVLTIFKQLSEYVLNNKSFMMYKLQLTLARGPLVPQDFYSRG